MKNSNLGILLFLSFLAFSIAGIGQRNLMSYYNCHHDGCEHGIIGLEEDQFSFTPPPASYEPYGPRDVVISVNYNGFSTEAQNAFQYAVDIWASILTSSQVIVIDANWESIGGGVLGFAGATNFYTNFAGAPEPNVYYPSALADKLAGTNLFLNNADVEATFDSGSNWYFGTDGNTPSGQFDFVTVVLHELGHGLGVIGSADYDGSNGFIGLAGNPVIYDFYAENGSGVDITAFSSGTVALGNELTGNDLFWNGPQAVSNNGGTIPKIYAPASWSGGSSFSHLDENTYPNGNPNSLMTPFVNPGEAIHDPGAIIVGLMEDIGWDIDDGTGGGCDDNVITLSLTPDCWGSEVTWSVSSADGTVTYATGGPYGDNLPSGGSTIVQEICVPDGCYIFEIADSFGDGMSGSQYAECDVDGYYEIIDAGFNTLVQIGDVDYGTGTSHSFCIGDVDECGPFDITFEQLPCVDDGEGNLVPIFQMEFDIAGPCLVQDFCFALDGGEFECFNLPGLDIFIADTDTLFLNNTAPDGFYEIYFTTEDGSISDVYTFQNGNCDNEEIICDCADTEHTIGVLGWLGDGFEDDGSFDWVGQPVDFNCETWAYDCGDFGIVDDPFGVCDGNLPPNNGCGGDIIFGCTANTACNYDATATADDGTCFFIGDPCDDGNGNTSNDTIQSNCECEGVLPIDGCTDVTACNFDPEATIDDDSCLFIGEPCDDNNTSTIDDVITEDCECVGVLAVPGCTDDNACNFDPEANIDNNSCEYESCAGCTDVIACNFDPEATLDDESCFYPGDECDDDDTSTIDDTVQSDCSCEGIEAIPGCTDESACNFDLEANIDNGSCDYESCAGCIEITACNYDPEATIEDDSCIFPGDACDDGNADTIDDMIQSDCSCEGIEAIPGCTDPEACNYSEDANLDDGSCDFESCAGCTDEAAINYDEDATIDDGSCIYDCEYPELIFETFCEEGDSLNFYISIEIEDLGNGAPYTVTNNVNADEVTLSFLGTIEMGPFTNEEDVLISIVSDPLAGCFLTSSLLSDDCSNLIGVDEIENGSWKIFPNPSTGLIYLTNDKTFEGTLQVVSIDGRMILNEQFINNGGELKVLDLNAANGIYFINILDGDTTTTQKIVIRK